MQKDIDDLRREHEHEVEVEKSFHTNPIKREIQKLFENEFSGDQYAKFPLPKAKTLVMERLQKAGQEGGVHQAVAARLTRKTSNIRSVEELLLMLNEYLFS
jgi:hypothetical protein